MIARVLTLMGLLCAVPIGAQAQAGSTPSDIVRAYFDAHYSDQWDAAALLFHPEFAVRFKNTYLSSTVEFRGPEPLADSVAASLEPAALLAHTLRAGDFRQRFREALRAAPTDPAPPSPVAVEQVLRLKPHIVGHFIEGDWAWVLYRPTLTAAPSVPALRETPAVIALRRHRDGWLLADHSLAGGGAVRGYFIPAN